MTDSASDTGPDAGPDGAFGRPAAVADELRSASEQANDDLLTQAHLLAPHQLPTAISDYAGWLGAR